MLPERASVDTINIPINCRGLKGARKIHHDEHLKASRLHARQHVSFAEAHLERCAGGLAFLYRAGEDNAEEAETSESYATWLE